MKIFSSASGNTTVPMSRPSITTPRRRPISCCMATSLRRTAGMALTWEGVSSKGRNYYNPFVEIMKNGSRAAAKK